MLLVRRGLPLQIDFPSQIKLLFSRESLTPRVRDRSYPMNAEFGKAVAAKSWTLVVSVEHCDPSLISLVYFKGNCSPSQHVILSEITVL